MDKVKFYTHYDRPECDCESYELGTSLTVPDQVEPVSVTVARCLRGEVLTGMNQKPTYYEYDGNVDLDKVSMDETMSPGFDLADVPTLVESVAATGGEGTPTKSSVGEQATAGVTTQAAPVSETESKETSESDK